LIERTTATNDLTPSLHPHYRSFITTTSQSASAPRDGTQSLPVSAGRNSPSYRPGRTGISGRAFSRSTWKQQTGLTSLPCRTPPGQ